MSGNLVIASQLLVSLMVCYRLSCLLVWLGNRAEQREQLEIDASKAHAELTEHLNEDDREWLALNLALAGIDSEPVSGYSRSRQVEEPSQVRGRPDEELGLFGSIRKYGLFDSETREDIIDRLKAEHGIDVPALESNSTDHRDDCSYCYDVESCEFDEPMYTIHELTSGAKIKTMTTHNRFKCNCLDCIDYLLAR